MNVDPVVDGMGRPVGLLARNDLIRALKERGPHARVAGDLLYNKLPRKWIPPGTAIGRL